MASCIETIVLFRLEMKVEFDYSPSEPATHEYPGCDEVIDPCSVIVFINDFAVDASWMCVSDELCERIVMALYEKREERKHAV